MSLFYRFAHSESSRLEISWFLQHGGLSLERIFWDQKNDNIICNKIDGHPSASKFEIILALLVLYPSGRVLIWDPIGRHGTQGIH